MANMVRNNELHNADYNFWLQYDYIQDKVFIDDLDYFERP